MVQITCDMPHPEGEVPAETATLSVGRETIEIDLCPTHEVQLLLPLREAGRTVRKPGRKPRATTKPA